MRYVKMLALVSLVFLFIQTGFSQTPADDLLKMILAPSELDIQAAKQENAQVFRIFRRGTRDDLSVRGGGAFYSFINKDHSYNKIPQIGFERDKLMVAFSGANGGFIADLGQTPLSLVNKDSGSLTFLSAYRPPVIVSEARVEFERSQRGFTVDGTAYRRYVVPVEGNTYALRAISYGEADTLVAFKIYRKDVDGSLIIFWKLLENFETPQFAKNQ